MPTGEGTIVLSCSLPIVLPFLILAKEPLRRSHASDGQLIFRATLIRYLGRSHQAILPSSLNHEGLRESDSQSDKYSQE